MDEQDLPATDPEGAPPVVDRAEWERHRQELLAREKEHTRAGDALAAARRRLPWSSASAAPTTSGTCRMRPLCTPRT